MEEKTFLNSPIPRKSGFKKFLGWLFFLIILFCSFFFWWHYYSVFGDGVISG